MIVTMHGANNVKFIYGTSDSVESLLSAVVSNIKPITVT
jgi:hypothetical protein